MEILTPQDTRKCSINALKTVYYVIVGLAITTALSRTFLSSEGLFIGFKIISLEHLPKTLLLLTLLPTICRFMHGASIHLGVISEKRYKPIFDFIGFFLQASLLYLMAISLEDPFKFVFLFTIMLIFDAVWLFLLKRKKYIKWGKIENQWRKSDLIIITVYSLIYSTKYYLSNILILISIIILLVAWIATYFDYKSNRDFYFPDDSPSLKK